MSVSLAKLGDLLKNLAREHVGAESASPPVTGPTPKRKRVKLSVTPGSANPDLKFKNPKASASVNSSVTPNLEQVPAATPTSVAGGGRLPKASASSSLPDLTPLKSDAGKHLEKVSMLPTFQCTHIIVSNVDVPWVTSDFAGWSRVLAGIMFTGSVAQVKDPIGDYVVPCVVTEEHPDSLLVLPLNYEVPACVPALRTLARPQTLPVHTHFAKDSPMNPSIVTYASAVMAISALKGVPIGTVRCYARHSVDIALNCSMIHRALGSLLPAVASKALCIVPSILFHEETEVADTAEVVYRILLGREADLAATYTVFFGASTLDHLRSHPGVIVPAELDFLLVWDSNALRNLPFDRRLSSEDFLLPASRWVYKLRIPPLQQYTLGHFLVVFLLACGGDISSTTPSEVVDTKACCRFVARGDSYMLIMSSPIPEAVVSRLHKAYATSSLVLQSHITGEPNRAVLLGALHSARSADWHAQWNLTPALSLMPAAPPGPPPPLSDVLLVQDELRRLRESSELGIGHLEDELEKASTSLRSVVLDLAEHGSMLSDTQKDLDGLRAQLGPTSTRYSQLDSQVQELSSSLLRAHASITRLEQIQTTLGAQVFDVLKSLSNRMAALETHPGSPTGHELTPSGDFSFTAGVGEDSDPFEEEEWDSVEGAEGDEEELASVGSDPSSHVLVHPSLGAPVAQSQFSFVAELDSSVPAGIEALISHITAVVNGAPSAAPEDEATVPQSAPGLSVEPAPLDPSYAATVLPPPLAWTCPLDPVAAVAVDTFGFRTFTPIALNCTGAIRSVSLAPCVTKQRVPLLRLTLLLPEEAWGISLLLPSNIDYSRTHKMELMALAAVILHRRLRGSPASLSTSLKPQYFWEGTSLPYWLTLSRRVLVRELWDTSGSHCAQVRKRRLSLKGSPVLKVDTMGNMAWEAFSKIQPHLHLLQDLTLRVIAALSELRIVVGPYSLRLKLESQRAAMLLLEGMSSGTELSELILGQLPCTVSVAGPEPPELRKFGDFNLLHAFGASRKMRNPGCSDFPAEFLIPSKSGPAEVFKNRAPPLQRAAFLQLFDPPDADMSSWQLFDEWLSSTKRPDRLTDRSFTDESLLPALGKSHWLGSAWRRQKNGDLLPFMSPLPLASALSVHEGHHIVVDTVQENLSMAWVPPGWPADTYATLRAAMEDMLRDLRPSILEAGRRGLLTPDPLGLEYSSASFTI